MDSTRRALLSTIGTVTVLSGCIGGNNGADSGSTETTTTTTMSTSMTDTSTTGTGTNDVTVDVTSHPDFGKILVGPKGKTLYLFEKDTNGKKASVCYDSCAQTWPPLVVDGSPTKSKAVTASITTFERKTGKMQVMAGGWPLYYFASDEQLGDANGQGLNDVWWVVAPDGSAVKSTSSASSTSSTTNSGY